MSDGFIHGPATYLGKVSNDTLSFSYTTQSDDNADLIDFSHIELNGAILKKSDGSDIDTDIKDGLFSSKHKIGMDTVVDLSITLNGLREQPPPPDTPNPGPGPWLINGSLYPVIEVNGRDIEGFSYKLVSSSEDCKKDGGFTTVHAKSVTLDMSKESAGPKYLCALGKVSSGFIKPLESGASEYPWYYDNTIPNIVNVTAPDGDDIYKESETITVRLEFSETVNLTNPSSLQLSFVNDLDSTVTGNAQYDSGDGTKFLNFEYLVQAGDNSSQLNVKELLLNGAEIKDLAGNSADIYISNTALQKNNTVKIDTLAPRVIDIDTLSPSGYYSAGEKIEIEVKFSEVVKVVGSPELVFTTDSYNNTPLQHASYSRQAADMKSIHFEYVVQANDNHAGIDIASISLTPNSIDILDLAGNQMNPIFDADLLSKNKQISFINFTDIDLSLKNSNGDLDDFDRFNDNSLTLEVTGTNKFRYKVVSNPAACDIDSSYLQSSSNPMTLTFSSSSNELVVICVSPVLDNGLKSL